MYEYSRILCMMVVGSRPEKYHYSVRSESSVFQQLKLLGRGVSLGMGLMCAGDLTS